MLEGIFSHCTAGVMICLWIKSLEKHKTKKKTLFFVINRFQSYRVPMYVCKYRRGKYVSTWSSDYLIHIECSFWNISFRSICWGVKCHAVRDKGGELAIFFCVSLLFIQCDSLTPVYLWVESTISTFIYCYSHCLLKINEHTGCWR